MNIEQLYDSRFDASALLTPYASAAEYLADRMRFLEVCLIVACAAKGLSGGELPSPASVGEARGLSVSSSDLFSITVPTAVTR